MSLKKRLLFCVCALGLLAIAANVVFRLLDRTPPEHSPEANFWLEEIPPNFQSDSPLIFYYHGAGADERQGMDKLARLRSRFFARAN